MGGGGSVGAEIATMKTGRSVLVKCKNPRPIFLKLMESRHQFSEHQTRSR